MLKLPPHDGSATSVKIDERDTETIATTEVIKDGQYLEILVPPDADDLYANNITAQAQQKLGDSLIDLEEVIRINSELKNSIEVGTKQINNLQQNLDASNAEIDELKVQMVELKKQYGDESNIQTQALATSGKDISDGSILTISGELIAKYKADPWTVLIIITTVGIFIVLLIIMLYRMYVDRRDEQFGEEFEFMERVSDNELKARIKQKLALNQVGRK
jgi:prefoldin subunit 5